MPVGGYDPEDLDEKLSELMDADGRDPSNWLTDEELAEWEDGGSLVDLLDEDDIHELLQKEGEVPDEGSDEAGDSDARAE